MKTKSFLEHHMTMQSELFLRLLQNRLFLIRASLISMVLLLGLVANSVAAVHYVDLNSPNPATPHTSWETAARDIQDALNVAIPDGEIVVTNGIYSEGGGIVGDAGANRVTIDKALHLRSVSGPTLTTIDGAGLMRCVYLANGATLAGFTLRNGNAEGGGISCEEGSATVSDRIILNNFAEFGGGASATADSRLALNNCLVLSNSASFELEELILSL